MPPRCASPPGLTWDGQPGNEYLHKPRRAIAARLSKFTTCNFDIALPEKIHMKKCAFLLLVMLALPLAAQARGVEIDLTFESSSGDSKILVADSFETIKRSDISLGTIRDLQNKVSNLEDENADLRRRLEDLERKVK